jgi:DNA-binding CsgD family transcriptional regulator
MIANMTVDAALREDLMQEAMIHLWQSEEQRPGQTRSWYLQSCRFHLKHYLAAGRSVDSTKRRAGRVPFPEMSEDQCDMLGRSEPESSVLGLVNAREIMFLLSRQLTARERFILNCLAEGMGAREIAGKLKVSHPTVIKLRRKIAALAIKLGVSMPANGHRHHNNGGRNDIEVTNGASRPNGKASSRMEVFEPKRATG